jgi:hypothetical protein
MSYRGRRRVLLWIFGLFILSGCTMSGAWLFFAETRFAVQAMIEDDYGPDDIKLTLEKVGWHDQVHFYVQYRVSVPNKGVFESSVPRMSTIASWCTHPRCDTGYFGDLFPEY